MVRRIRRSTLFSLIAVVALLSLGIGYAAWTETLTLNGSVTTAEFDVDWENDNEIISGNPHGGTCEADITGASFENLNVVLDNVYPGFTCQVTADIRNNGEVPVEASNVGVLPDPVHPLALGITYNDCVVNGTVIAPSTAVACSFTIEVLDTSDPGETYLATASAQFDVAS